MKLLISAWFCLALLFSNVSQAVEIADFHIDDTIRVSNTALKLNGAGIRKKTFYNVTVAYVVALYLAEKENTAEGVFNASGPKQINLTMIEPISSRTLRQAFKDVDKKNTSAAERVRLGDQFRQFDQLFFTIPELKEGDVISIEWIPDSGTAMLVNGEKIGETFPDQLFFHVLLRIWLGEKPVNGDLKKQLLGGG